MDGVKFGIQPLGAVEILLRKIPVLQMALKLSAEQIERRVTRLSLNFLRNPLDLSPDVPVCQERYCPRAGNGQY
jgi:hypothetical protein